MDKQLLALFIERLKEEGAYLLAEPEEAGFFRQIFLKAKPVEAAPVFIEPIIKIPERKKEEPPPPLPKPAPVSVIEEPPLPKPSSHLRQLISFLAPELALLDVIPSDAHARKIAERWKTKNQAAPISILTFQEPQEHRVLLENIACALSVYFGEVKIVAAEGIEKEKQWETFLSHAGLKLVIACDYTLWQLSNLMTLYKEKEAVRTVGSVPLFLLPDLSLYLKDPLLKRLLWKALCQRCS